MGSDTKTVLALLDAQDEAIKRRDQVQIHVIRRTLESLSSESVESAVEIRLEHSNGRPKGAK